MFVSVLMSMLLLVFSSPTPAAEQTLTPPHGDPHCWDHAMTQYAMDVCASKNAHDADAAMNAAYKELRKRGPDGFTRKRLEAAQTAWLSYRKAELEAKYPEDDPKQSWFGTIWPMCVDLDYAAMTNARTAELKRLLFVREGDSCAGIYFQVIH